VIAADEQEADDVFGHDWEPGQATILARKNKPRNQTSSSYEFIADIKPDGGAASFRATFEGPQSATGFEAPQVGAVVPVLCDPKHDKVKFDVSDPAFRWDTGIKQESADFDALQHGPQLPGAGSAPWTEAAEPIRMSDPAGGWDPAAEAALKTADEAFQAALAEGRATIEAFGLAKQSGDPVEISRLKAQVAAGNEAVQRLNAECQRLSALRLEGSSGRSAANPASSTPAVDPLERLEKLADLHDRGVLDDAEFAVQKAKILGEGP
jgi:Short C-terminal domain